MDRQSIIKEIEAYAVAMWLAPATVTERAVANSRLYARMVDGGDCTTRIAQRLRSYIAENPPRKVDSTTPEWLPKDQGAA